MTWRTEKIIPLAGQSGSHGRYIAKSWIPWNPQTGVFYTVKDIGNSSHRMISEKEGKYTIKVLLKPRKLEKVRGSGLLPWPLMKAVKRSQSQ